MVELTNGDLRPPDRGRFLCDRLYLLFCRLLLAVVNDCEEERSEGLNRLVGKLADYFEFGRR